MLNIVIYEVNDSFMTKNINSINMALANSDIDYRIHKFNKYSTKLDEVIRNNDFKKVYIISTSVSDISALELVSLIRSNDWDSMIIITTDNEDSDVSFNGLMIFDCINKNKDYEKRLLKDIEVAQKIFYRQKNFIFKYNHVVYRIPYEHICYIEKESSIKRCIIHTLNNDFYIVKSIKWLCDNLGSEFIKTHQSCIVNKNNIKEIDLGLNTIIFDNGIRTNLLTNSKKKEIKEFVGLIM